MKKYLIGLLVFSLMACHDNEMKVEVTGIEDKVHIELKVLETDKIIYENKRQTGAIPDEYGENDWYLTYSDSLCARFRHLKLNARDKHSYFFRFYRTEEDIYCQISIKGEFPAEHTILLEKCPGPSKL